MFHYPQTPPKKKKEKKNEHLQNVFFRTSAASANDCTGITPTVPETSFEAESYFDVIDLPVTSVDGAEFFKRIP